MSKARRKGLSAECIEGNLEDIVSISRKEGIPVNPQTISLRRTIFECPYRGCSKEFEAKGLLTHLATHDIKIKSEIKCPFCDKNVRSMNLIAHVENKHPEITVDKSMQQLTPVNAKHALIRDSIMSKDSSKRRQVADQVSKDLEDSAFTPSTSSLTFDAFRLSLRRKLFENVVDNINLAFKFLTRTNALEWSCIICADSKGLSWKNPISLRLHTLLHLEKHAEDEHFEHLKHIVQKEWSLLLKEVPTLPLDKLRRNEDFPVGRSLLSYCLLREDERVGAVMDVIDNCCVDGVPKKMRTALCLVCHSPFSVSLLQPLLTPPHFMVDSHRHLKVKGWSEFSEVSEISEMGRREEGREEEGEKERRALMYSVFSHLGDEADAVPHKLFKWKCTLCSLDVALFPSSISLRFYALRHLEREHGGVYKEGVYRHEWQLLQIETSLINMRGYSQEKAVRAEGRGLDICDPSDFIFPWQRALRVPVGYYTCGHCFYVMRRTEVEDHLGGHGYCREEGISARIVLEEGGQSAMIDERTIRGLRKTLSIPDSILCTGEEEEERSDLPAASASLATPMVSEDAAAAGAATSMSEKREEIGTTPLRSCSSSSKYRLRERSGGAARYVPLIEEESRDEDTMSSAESDSGHEAEYQTMGMSAEDTMDEEEEEEEEEMTALPSTSRGKSSERKTTRNNNNTCTESSIASEVLEMGGAGGGGKEEKKRARGRVHPRAFVWEGAEPAPLPAEQIDIVRQFKEGGRCSLCPRTKGYRGVGRMTNVEQSMMAHLIVHHWKDEQAKAILERKRYLLATSLSSSTSDVVVPPFLMQSVHTHYLTCSRCMEFKCAKQSNLVIHFESCGGVKGNRWKSVNRRGSAKKERKEGEEEEGGEERAGSVTPSPTTTPKRRLETVRCPLCREGWRKSSHYSDDVSVAVHLLMKHTMEEEAYRMAMQIEEESSLPTTYPFLNLRDSFVFRVKNGESGVQCALCDVNSPSLAPAIRHATRSHANVKEKEEAKFNPGLIPCPLPSSSCSIRSTWMGRQRSAVASGFHHVLMSHTKEEDEARAYMDGLSESDKQTLRDEPNLRLDADKCVESWLSGRPYLHCALCGHSSRCAYAHCSHFGVGCGQSEDWNEKRRKGKKEGSSSTQPSSQQLQLQQLMEMQSEKRGGRIGRGRQPESAMKCPHCARLIYASACYAPSISMDIHVMKMHPKEKEEGGMKTAPSTFPFIDFSLSSPDSLRCALCEYTAKESRYMIPHAWTKHLKESQSSEGLEAWAEFESEQTRKREKQRKSCGRGEKRRRAEERERMREEEREGEEEGMIGVMKLEETSFNDGSSSVKRARREEEEGEGEGVAMATAIIKTPRQRSTVSRWLEKSVREGEKRGEEGGGEKEKEDLRERLERLFGNGSGPSTSRQQSSTAAAAGAASCSNQPTSIFKELPEASLSRMNTASQRAEDISHIEGIEGVRCSVCSFKGRNTEQLRIHFQEAHQEVMSLSAPQVFPCAVCSSVFNSKKKWRCHAEEDHRPKERPFQCFKCEFRYETFQKLRSHQIRVHESEILVHPDDRTCHQCSRLFGSLRTYRNHMERHERRERMEDGE